MCRLVLFCAHIIRKSARRIRSEKIVRVRRGGCIAVIVIFPAPAIPDAEIRKIAPVDPAPKLFGQLVRLGQHQHQPNAADAQYIAVVQNDFARPRIAVAANARVCVPAHVQPALRHLVYGVPGANAAVAHANVRAGR